jgi:glycosyltransferase involved in cell wall biosynthesis
MPVSILILTFNSAATIGATLESAVAISDDVHVVDSGSTDATLDISSRLGAKIHAHPFESYGAQRNWAIDTLPVKHPWQLHLDADERLTPQLASAVVSVVEEVEARVVGYFIPRLTYFLGSPIRHGGMYPIWHMRLFKTGVGRCESRKYDQHFYVDGATGRLPYPMIDDIRMSLTEWTSRHNRWSDAEADEQEMRGEPRSEVIGGRFGGTPVEEKRALRGAYNLAPHFWRAFGLFLYRYVIRLGFLDGRPGLIFFILQTFWFRFLVDAKLYERKRR